VAERRDIARSFGATHTNDPGSEDLLGTIRPLDRPEPGLERVAKASGFAWLIELFEGKRSASVFL